MAERATLLVEHAIGLGVLPEALLVSGQVRPGWGLLARDGRIGAVGDAAALAAAHGGAVPEALPGMLLG
jgi:hypothetical protein